MRTTYRLAALALAVLLLSACGSVATGTGGWHHPFAAAAHWPSTALSGSAAGAAGQTAVPALNHVFIVVMENLSYRDGSGQPGFRALAQRYAAATQYYGVAHPSLPNYLALTSGDTYGVRSDCWFCYRDVPNLGGQLDAAGLPWGVYLEGLPWNGWLGPWWPFTGYAGKHDPFRYYTDVRASRKAWGHLHPLGALTRVLGGPAARVPRLAWVTPNLCHDGHSCPPGVAAQWLDGFVAQVTASAAWRDTGHGENVLFVTWDEGSFKDTRGVGPDGRVTATGGGGHVLTLVIAPDLPPGERVSLPYNHYSLLKTIEEALSLPLLGKAGAPGTRDLGAFWGGE